MPKPCCAIYEHPQGMSALVRRSVERIRVMSEEIEEQRAKVHTCPGPCSDRSILVTLRSGRQQRVHCPIANSHCPYGTALEKELDAYLLGVMFEIGVPKRHLDNFARYRETISTRESVKWPLRGFLVLCGRPGVGKSFGATWGIRHYLRERIADPLERNSWQEAERAACGVLWCSAGEIAGDRNLATKAKDKSLLVLDDLGKECNASNAMTALSDIVSRRYDQKLPTVVTTELSISDIGNRYGRHIAERLVEDIGNGGRIVDCGEVSMRLGT